MSFVDRSPLLAALNYFKGQVSYRLGLRRHQSGSTGLQLGAEATVEYVRRVASDYVRYGAGGDATRLEGKDVLEIGPGDNLGVALMLLARGARSVTCMDGFVPRSSEETNRRIYTTLYQSLDEAQRDRLADVVKLDQNGVVCPQMGDRLAAFYGASIESNHPALTPERYDLVVSRAVLEHVGDLNAGWRMMHSTLRRDGEMWHKVDFRSHKLFEQIHPLFFLTFEERVWRLISRPDPTLNRARLPEYRALLQQDFSEWTIYTTHVFNRCDLEPHPVSLVAGRDYQQADVDQVQVIRSRLALPFREYSDNDLLVSGIFLSARKKRN